MKTVIIALLLLPSLAVMGQEDGGHQKNPPLVEAIQQSLEISLRGPNWSQTVSCDEPLSVSLSNRGNSPIYLLDLFMVRGRPFSFAITIRDHRGRQILHYFPRIKIEMAGPLKYIALEPGETYTLTLPLPEMIKQSYPGKLPPGKYTLVTTYENQLGHRCFKGTITSKPIELIVKD